MNKAVNDNKKNKLDQACLFVISAPSGAGKTTLVRKLLLRNPRVKFSISYTTRPARSRERNGDDYFFVDKDQFQKMVDDNEFLEHATVFDNYYGTSRKQVRAELDAGQHVLLEIDWQGAQQIRNAWPDCVSIFILPPSLNELERRLRSRATDSEAIINRRLQDSISDIGHWPEFDHVIINDDLESALIELEAIIDGKNCETDVNNLARQQQISNCGFAANQKPANEEE